MFKKVEEGDKSFRLTKELPLAAAKYLLVSDCKNADLIKIEKQNKKEIYFAFALKHSYKKGAQVRVFKRTAYFIKQHSNRDGRGLYYHQEGQRNAVELISDIDDMQICYKVKNSGSECLKSNRIKSWGEVSGVLIELKMRSGSLSKKKQIHVRLRNYAA